MGEEILNVITVKDAVRCSKSRCLVRYLIHTKFYNIAYSDLNIYPKALVTLTSVGYWLAENFYLCAFIFDSYNI